MEEKKLPNFYDIKKEMLEGLEVLITDYISVHIPDQTDEIKKVTGNIFRDNFSHLLISAYNCGYIAGKKFSGDSKCHQ